MVHIRTPETSVTVERLREVLHYDPVSGVFVWKQRLSPRGLVGTRAGSVRPLPNKEPGYRIISIDGVGYAEHRLAWLYVHGVWPVGEIDHHNGNKRENWIDNLRDATPTVNLQNLQRARSNSQTGFLGVVRTVRANGTVRFQARITHPGKRGQYLGSCETPEAAYALYLEAKRKLHEGNTL